MRQLLTVCFKLQINASAGFNCLSAHLIQTSLLYKEKHMIFVQI